MVFLSLFLSLVLTRVPCLGKEKDQQTKRILALSGNSSTSLYQSNLVKSRFYQNSRVLAASGTQTHAPWRVLSNSTCHESLPRLPASPQLPSHQILSRCLNLPSLRAHRYFQALPTASECWHVFQINIPKRVFACPTNPLLYYIVPSQLRASPFSNNVSAILNFPPHRSHHA